MNELEQRDATKYPDAVVQDLAVTHQQDEHGERLLFDASVPMEHGKVRTRG